METDNSKLAGALPALVLRQVPVALPLSVVFAAAIIYLRPLVPSLNVGLVVLVASGVVLLPVAILEGRWFRKNELLGTCFCGDV